MLPSPSAFSSLPQQFASILFVLTQGATPKKDVRCFHGRDLHSGRQVYRLTGSSNNKRGTTNVDLTLDNIQAIGKKLLTVTAGWPFDGDRYYTELVWVTGACVRHMHRYRRLC